MKPNLLRLSAAIALGAALLGAATAASATKLAGRAVLPAETFASGPTSGQYLGAGPINGVSLPFVDRQPVQGFSAVLDNHDGTFNAMPDNGYGALENSADFNLRVYTIRPDFKRVSAGSGAIKVLGYFELRDPDRKLPFAIVNHFSKERILTGADFDIESMQRVADGTLWFGDEFGPFLIHTDATGKVLQAPVPLPDFSDPGKEIRSPQNPFSEETAGLRIMNAMRANARAHGGFKTPVFSPYYPELKYPASVRGPASDPDGQYSRGVHSPADLGPPAASDIHDIALLRAAGFPVVPYTVDDKPTMLRLMGEKVTGLISDRPDLLYQALQEFDANGDGTPGDYLDAQGLVDGSKFDAQGHRGGRDLRPENTLPAFEVALDNLMATIETDTGTPTDFEPVIFHDPYIEASKCRRADGAPYTVANQVLIKDYSSAQIQSTYICDKTFRGPSQQNDRALSPVAVAFAAQQGLMDPYVVPKLQNLYDFVKFYAAYYQSGPGASHPDAAKRVATANRVRFNVETKLNPRSDTDSEQGRVYKDRTVGPTRMAVELVKVITRNHMEARTDVQSFDFRTLIWVQNNYPAIRTVCLVGDFPVFNGADSDDGTNLQGENGGNTPWLAGLYWPYRQTLLSNPFRAARSGGFEGMAVNPAGTVLYPLLEQPLVGDTPKTLRIHEFDVRRRRYTGNIWGYALDARGTNIGDFVIFNNQREGLVIERDGSQGNLNGFKAIFKVGLGAPGTSVSKSLLVDLQNILDTHGISLPAQPGDVGLGNPFSFPFTTIEDVVVFGPRRIGVINDNNYPFSVGRHLGSSAPDDTEFILLQTDEALNVEAAP